MNNATAPISITVFANREDFWFTKICVASIRYYYPDVKIYLVKDRLNGDFSTGYFCKRFNIGLVDLGRKFYGWSAAKMHFLVNDTLPKGKYLTLDSDIIFSGAVLEKLESVAADFIVHAEHYKEPFPPSVKENFFEIGEVKKLYTNYEYPGFFFNCGQMVITSGMVRKEIFKDCCNFDEYPYYNNRAVFPMVDQSILNCVLPVLDRENEIRLSGADFMLWSVSYFKEAGSDDPEKIKDRGNLPYLIHYAGDTRSYDINTMKGKNILSFFKQYYYSKLTSSQRILSDWQDRWFANKKVNKILYRRNKLLIKLLSIN